MPYPMLVEVQRIQLYLNRPDRAHAFAQTLLDVGKRSLHFRIQILRMQGLYAHGSATIALYSWKHESQGRGLLEQSLPRQWRQREALPSRMLLAVARNARAIEREGMAWMQPFADVLRAGIVHLGGARLEASAMLETAAARFEAHDMMPYAVAARYRAVCARGEGGANDAAALCKRFQAEGVVAPNRFIASLIPQLPE